MRRWDRPQTKIFFLILALRCSSESFLFFCLRGVNKSFTSQGAAVAVLHSLPSAPALACDGRDRCIGGEEVPDNFGVLMTQRCV